MKYIVYCRKSSEEDTKQVQSLDTQFRLLSDVVTSQKLNVVQVFRESKSAKNSDQRPLFAQMLEMIKSCKADGILTVHTDRLARNLVEAGQIIELLDRGLLKEVRTPVTVYDTYQSLLYMGFDFVFAAQYSRDLSVKVRAGLESKLLRGEYPSNAPIGYLNVHPGKGIIPDPVRSPYVIQAYELFATGQYSVKTLAKKLFSDGLRTKNGKQIATSAVHRMLYDPVYYGSILRKGKVYPGKHEPLITKAIFDTVQERLSSKSRPRKQIHDFIYKDFLTCAVCDCRITAGISKGKYVYYRCTNGKGLCEQHKKYWSQDSVRSSFQSFFSGFSLSSDLANTSFDLYRSSVLEGTQTNEHHRATLEGTLTSLQQKLGRLEDMFLEERISSESYDKKRKLLLDEQATVKDQLKHISKTSNETTLELLEEFKNQAISLDKIFENGDDEVKQDLLRSVLWNCTFQDGEIISTRLNKLWQPLENLNKTQDLEIWRRGRDSNPR